MLALEVRRPNELDPHANLGMHDAHHAFHPALKFRKPHSQENSRIRGKWRCHLEVGAARTEVGERTWGRRIVGFDLRRMPSHPGLKPVTIVGRQVHEAKPRLRAVALPCRFRCAFDALIRPWQSKFDSHRTAVLCATREFERHSTLTNIRSNGLALASSVLTGENYRNLDGDPRVAAAFALHQSPSRTKTASSPFGGDRFIKCKVRAQRESAAHSFLAINHGDGDSALVTRGGADTLQHLGGHVLVVTVNDHRFESAAG